MARHVARRSNFIAGGLPQWIRPQLTELVDEAPNGPQWLHEIKFDGYRMHARLGRGAARRLPAAAATASRVGPRFKATKSCRCAAITPDISVDIDSAILAIAPT